jgi:hypothetical protein
MNKALCISAAMALAFSGAAFADHTQKHKSSSRSDSGASAQQFTESDCQSLSVESARSSCMRSIHAGRSGSDMATGATSDSGSGMAQGGGDSKRMHKRSKNQGSGSTAAQHRQGTSETPDSAR